MSNETSWRLDLHVICVAVDEVTTTQLAMRLKKQIRDVSLVVKIGRYCEDGLYRVDHSLCVLLKNVLIRLRHAEFSII
jgi:hypothetical protein